MHLHGWPQWRWCVVLSHVAHSAICTYLPNPTQQHSSGFCGRNSPTQLILWVCLHFGIGFSSLEEKKSCADWNQSCHSCNHRILQNSNVQLCDVSTWHCWKWAKHTWWSSHSWEEPARFCVAFQLSVCSSYQLWGQVRMCEGLEHTWRGF